MLKKNEHFYKCPIHFDAKKPIFYIVDMEIILLEENITGNRTNCNFVKKIVESKFKNLPK